MAADSRSPAHGRHRLHHPAGDRGKRPIGCPGAITEAGRASPSPVPAADRPGEAAGCSDGLSLLDDGTIE
jgi:hypothetical protein